MKRTFLFLVLSLIVLSILLPLNFNSSYSEERDSLQLYIKKVIDSYNDPYPYEGPDADGDNTKDLYVLIVGVGDYYSPTLDLDVSDAVKLYNAFIQWKSDGKLKYSEVKIIKLIDNVHDNTITVNWNAFSNRIKYIDGQTDGWDRIIIYFAGLSNDTGFLLGDGTFVTYRALRDMLKALSFRVDFVWFASCESYYIFNKIRGTL